MTELIKSMSTSMELHTFFISNTRLKLAKNKQNLSSALRLNFCFLKIIRLFHPWYHPKIVGHILKTCMKPSVSVLMKLYDKKNNKKVCIIQTVRILYSSVIKHVNII